MSDHTEVLYKILDCLNRGDVDGAKEAARNAIIGERIGEPEICPEGREYLLARISPEPNTGCWLWCGGYDSYGYGAVSKGKNFKRYYGAHRAIYLALVGPIPFGAQLDHKCGVRGCCNPDHLEPIDNRLNVARGVDRAKAVGGKYRGRARKYDPSAIRSMKADGLGFAEIVRRSGASEATVVRALR